MDIDHTVAAYLNKLDLPAITDSDKKAIQGFVDLTSLNENDTNDDITQLCQNAKQHGSAAVCVYPQFIQHAKRQLSNTNIKIATVVNFPHGEDTITDVEQAILQAIQAGADEIDAVFPYYKFLDGDIAFVADFLSRIRAACGKHCLKIILETGAFPDLTKLFNAAELCIEHHADFLKTSTGKIAVGATPESAATLLLAIKANNQKIGCKLSGGIRNFDNAHLYTTLVKAILGEHHISVTTFRIGASRVF